MSEIKNDFLGKIKKFPFINFRNLSSDVVELSQGLNCFFGENGNGKTNVLEGIFLLSERKSFRKKATFPQLLSFDCEKPEIILSASYRPADREEDLSSLQVRLTPNEVRATQNGKTERKKKNFSSYFLGPFDSYQFSQSTSFRRKWLDDALSKVDPSYSYHLKRFQRALAQRNYLLQRRALDSREQIVALDETMATDAHSVFRMRQDYLQEISPYLAKTYQGLFHEEAKLAVSCESNFDIKHLDYRSQYLLELARDRDDRGPTEKGPHRDNIQLFYNGFSVFEYGSLGQQKMGFLALVFAYIELFRYKKHSYPIILIDDVSGELDGRRWENLLNFFKAQDFQVVMTTANESFKNQLVEVWREKNLRLFCVKDGLLKRETLEK